MAEVGAERLGRITAIVALVLAVVCGIAAAMRVPFVAQTPVSGGLVVFLAALSLLLALRGLLLRRRAPSALAPSFIAAIPAAAALAAAGVLAFHERGSALESGPIGREHEAAMVAWEVGVAHGRARDLATIGLAALPGFALALLGLYLALGARRAARAASPAGEAGTAAVGAHRKAVAAGWAALLGAAAFVAGGLAVDALAIASPVEAPPHPRLADLAAVKEDLALARVDEACTKLERVLAADTPKELVDRELPGVEEIAHRCVGHGIERLPKGLACVEKATALASGATARLVHAEDRARAGCDRALTRD